MFYKLIAIVLLAASSIAVPVVDSTIPSVAVHHPVPDHTPGKAELVGAVKQKISGEINTISSRSDAGNPLVERFGELLILCSARNCGGACYSYNIGGLAAYTCYRPTIPNPYYSAYVYSPRGAGLPYGIYVGKIYVYISSSAPVLKGPKSNL